MGFIASFKEVQRLMTQIEQYTDLDEQQRETIEGLLPNEQLRGFRGAYLETAAQLRNQKRKPGGDDDDEIRQLDFEFVLFGSALIDYDYIMELIVRYSQDEPTKQKMTPEQLISLLKSSANLMDEHDDVVAYIYSLMPGAGFSERAIREGYEAFRAKKSAEALAEIGMRHGLEADAVQAFVDRILDRMIFDGHQPTDLLEPLDLGWKPRTEKELALIEDLVPLLKKRAKGREISGLALYE